jgi:hypothetical protein
MLNDQAIEYIDALDAILNPVIDPTMVEFPSVIGVTAVENARPSFGASEHTPKTYSAQEY